METNEECMRKILIVEDDKKACLLLKAYLEKQGYEVTATHTGLNFQSEFDRQAAGLSLVVLDVMLPDTDGFEIIRRLRRDGSRVPVIFLTARDTQADKVTGLTLGGDDYLTKPFGLEELAARVRSVLRRSRPKGPPEDSQLVFDDLELDQETYEVSRNGHPIDLSPTEFRLLRYLMLSPGRVLTRAQLLAHVWDYDFGGSSTVVSTYVAYLRRKLARYGPDLIHTQRGVGYSLRLPRLSDPSDPGETSGPGDNGGPGSPAGPGHSGRPDVA